MKRLLTELPATEPAAISEQLFVGIGCKSRPRVHQNRSEQLRLTPDRRRFVRSLHISRAAPEKTIWRTALPLSRGASSHVAGVPVPDVVPNSLKSQAACLLSALAQP